MVSHLGFRQSCRASPRMLRLSPTHTVTVTLRSFIIPCLYVLVFPTFPSYEFIRLGVTWARWRHSGGKSLFIACEYSCECNDLFTYKFYQYLEINPLDSRDICIPRDVEINQLRRCDYWTDSRMRSTHQPTSRWHLDRRPYKTNKPVETLTLTYNIG